MSNHGAGALQSHRPFALLRSYRGDSLTITKDSWLDSLALCRLRLGDFFPLQLFHGHAGSMFLNLGQIVIHLHAKPSLGAAADAALKPHRHLRRNGALSADDAVKLLAGYAKPCGRISDGKAKRVDFVLDQPPRMGRILHRHDTTLLSVVIHQINIEGVAVFEAENNPPVRTHGHGPKTLAIAGQRVKPERRQIHVLNPRGCCEQAEDVFDTLDMLRVDAFAVALLIQAFQTLVAKAGDHNPSL